MQFKLHSFDKNKIISYLINEKCINLGTSQYKITNNGPFLIFINLFFKIQNFNGLLICMLSQQTYIKTRIPVLYDSLFDNTLLDCQCSNNSFQCFFNYKSYIYSTIPLQQSALAESALLFNKTRLFSYFSTCPASNRFILLICT